MSTLHPLIHLLVPCTFVHCRHAFTLPPPFLSKDVGFYYMSNAGGRLFGTLVGGFLYDATQAKYGISVCMWVSAGCLVVATLSSLLLGPVAPKKAGGVGEGEGDDGGEVALQMNMHAEGGGEGEEKSGGSGRVVGEVPGGGTGDDSGGETAAVAIRRKVGEEDAELH